MAKLAHPVPRFWSPGQWAQFLGDWADEMEQATARALSPKSKKDGQEAVRELRADVDAIKKELAEK